MAGRMKKLQKHLKSSKKIKKSKGRILAEDKLSHPDFDQDGKMNEEVNVISQFNKEFKTALVRPITYNFNEDTTTQHQVDYEASLFNMGIDKIYNLPKYRVVLREYGIDYFTISQGAVINKNNAIKVFQQIDPSNLDAGARELMNVLKFRK